MRLLALLLALCACQVQAALPSLVSTNLCADQLALSLAAPGQLLSVSRQSQDPARSSWAQQARQLPGNRASLEEVLALHPDIVIASRRWLAHNGGELLRRNGIRVVTPSYPVSWPQILASTREFATQIGRAEAGEALAQDVERRLQRLGQRGPAPRLLYLRANGGSAGRETYVDTLFAALGAHNAQRARGWGTVSLEALVEDPPDAFVLADMPGDQGLARSAYSRHPLFQALLEQRPAVRLPGNHWGCSDWQLIDSAEQLWAALQAVNL